MVATRETVRTGRTVERNRWASVGFGPGVVLGAIGAIGVVISMFLPWRDGGVHAGDIPIAFLWDRTAGSSDPSLLIALIPLAILLLVGAFVPLGSPVRLLGAIGLLVVAGLFAYQLDRSLDFFPGADLGDALDVGFYVAVIGGIVAFASALLPDGWGTRREVEVSEVVDDDSTVARPVR